MPAKLLHGVTKIVCEPCEPCGFRVCVFYEDGKVWHTGPLQTLKLGDKVFTEKEERFTVGPLDPAVSCVVGEKDAICIQGGVEMPGHLEHDREVVPILHALPETEGIGAVVVDEERAKGHCCKRFRTDGGELVFVPGAIGALTDAEKREFCQPLPECPSGFREQTGPPARRLHRQLQRFRRAARTCLAEVQEIKDPGNRLRARLQCLSRELGE